MLPVRLFLSVLHHLCHKVAIEQSEVKITDALAQRKLLSLLMFSRLTTKWM